MYLYAGGHDHACQIGIMPTTKSKYRNCVDAVTRVPFDLEGVQCVSGGSGHSVIIMHGSVFAAGYDTDFRIGSDSRQVYETFTEIKISEEPISWAACGGEFTLYLTVCGKAILCRLSPKGERIHVEVGKKAISVFAGIYYGGIIDEEGAIHILDKFDLLSKFDPHKPPRRFSFESPTVDIACCEHFVCALTSDGRVFANGKLNNDSQDFSEVSSLKGKKIKKLSGYCDTCAALTFDGHVFICGKNNHGQLGNGTTRDDYSSFTEVRIEEAIKDVSCSLHTLFLTESNKILGCGFNYYCQLFKKTEGIVLSPIEITRIEADQVITGCFHSFILSGNGKLENPAKAHFGFLKQEVENQPPHPNEKNKTRETAINIQTEISLNDQTESIGAKRKRVASLYFMHVNRSDAVNQSPAICQNQSHSINSQKELDKTLSKDELDELERLINSF